MTESVKTYFVILISLSLFSTASVFYWWISTLDETVRLSTLDETSQENSKNIIPKLLFWTQSPNYNELKLCGNYKCIFSTNRNILNNSETKAIIFQGWEIKSDDLPLPRLNHHIWVLSHEESPKYSANIYIENFLTHFNYTATFSRYSSFPLTTQFLGSYDELTSKEYVVPIGEKTKLRKRLAPVVFLQSRCNTLSGRDEYIEELMKFIPIDSYGKCLNNKKLPQL